MCAHYENLKQPHRLRDAFNVDPPPSLGKVDVWPGYEGVFIRRPREKDSGDEAVPDREAMTGLFGLVPYAAERLSSSK